MAKKKARKKPSGYYFRFGRFQFIVFLIGTAGILVLTFYIGFMAGRITSQGVENTVGVPSQKDGGKIPLSFYNMLKSDKKGDRPESAPRVKMTKDVEPAGNESKNRSESKTRSGPYMIQVAAYKDKGKAQTLADSLRSSGYEAAVYGEEKKDGWYRVRVGGFSKIGRAKDVAEEITREKGLDAFVVKVGGGDH